MAGRTVKIHLGGKDRELRLDLNAIAALCDKMGLSGRLNNLAEDLLGKPVPVSALRTMLWAALIWDDPTLTEEEVGSWVDLDNFGEVWESFFSLFRDKLSASTVARMKDLETAMVEGKPLDSVSVNN